MHINKHTKWIYDFILYLRTFVNKRKEFLKNLFEENQKNFKKFRKIMDRTKNLNKKVRKRETLA
jgi:hypothetical protein